MVLNASNFIIKVNEILNIIGCHNVIDTQIDMNKDVNVFNVKFKINENIFNVRYVCEKDEDEESGYYFKCLLYSKNSIIKRYNCINELIEGLKSKDYTVNQITKIQVIKIGMELASSWGARYLNFKVEDENKITFYMEEHGEHFYSTLTLDEIVKDYKHILKAI